MTTYAILGVSLDMRGRIKRASLSAVDPAKNEFVGPAEELAAAEIARLIAEGHTVTSLFMVPGGRVPGAKFRRTITDVGNFTVELESESPGKSLADLVLRA